MKTKVKLTPEEKAKQLFDRFDTEVRDLDNEISHTKEEAKQCALICLDELLDTVPYINNTPKQTLERMYYMDVRAELKKI